ncbi:unnamed protein product [Lota lota]
MGRKLDLSGLTDEEAEHVLKVVQRDMRLRKTEEERLSEMKQELAEEGSRCSLLSKQHLFNQHCCIRCCVPFTFLLNPRRRCLDCQYNVCKGCRTYCQRDRAWLCSACQKGRVLRTQSLEWYYNNVKSRFKRFGSAKVLKTLYRKHIDERGALSLSDLQEGSVQEGSNDNDDSVCGSDSAFYKQSEGHSMADTLTVALRVAEEAIEEAISKAEEFSDSLEKQNEARYLRDHKEDLIEELATTIVQKIIQRRKCSVMQSEYDFVLPQPATPLAPPSELASPALPQASSQGTQDPLPIPYSLWRSRSAFSLTSDDSPEKGPEDQTRAGAERGFPEYASLKREAKATSLPSWKSVDRLDNSSASSVLQSPDGNWMALQSSQLSRPSLLTKRKSLVFSVLEKESGGVSAYDEMGSESGGGDHNDNDDDDDGDEGGWGAALRQFRRKLSDETYYTDSQHDPEWTFTRHPSQPPPPPSPPQPTATSPSSGRYTDTEMQPCDPRPSSSPKHHRPLKKMGAPPPDHQQSADDGGFRHAQRHLHQEGPPAYQLPPEALDVNFNPKVMGDSSEAEERPSDPVRRSRRRRKSKRELSSEQSRPEGQGHTHSIHPLIQEAETNAEQQHGRRQRPDAGTDSRTWARQTRETCGESVDERGRECVEGEDVGRERRDKLRQKYSAASLCSITTEVLKVLNATEELIGEAGRGDSFTTPSESMSASPISSCSDTSRLDHRLTKMEENVYLAASAVYGLEGELGDLEECARSISSGTTDTELAFLEDQVATAAAQVQQSELQISNIEARISALKTAGLNVTACNRFSKYKPKPQTLDSSRHQRRKLPAPPLKEKLDQEQQVLRP